MSFVANTMGLEGFQEVVLSVRDLEKTKSMYMDLSDWVVEVEGEVSREILNHWELPQTCTATFCLLKYPYRDTGKVRLVCFDHIDQVHIRDSSQSWDTGGIYDLDVRVSDLLKSKEAFQKHGWSGYSKEEKYHFEEFHVSEILIRGAEDVVFALIQRHAPELVGFDEMTKLSHVFNSSQIVKDMDASKAFYMDQLGFQMYMEVNKSNGEHGPNIFGVPYNVWPSISRKIAILSPDGSNKGSVELVQLDGIEGKDFSSVAVPPNLGILMLRFPVKNLDAYLEAVEDAGGSVYIKAQELSFEPHGNIKQAVIKSPDGVWLEFFESIAS